MLSEIELSGIISGRLIHQGIHGRTKKYKLTVSSEMIKKSFKDELTLQDIIWVWAIILMKHLERF